jgi:hypothetical protein
MGLARGFQAPEELPAKNGLPSLKALPPPRPLGKRLSLSFIMGQGKRSLNFSRISHGSVPPYVPPSPKTWAGLSPVRNLVWSLV